MVNLQEFLSKLHPSFDDCPELCSRSEDGGEPKDLPDFCAECDVSKQLQFFTESAAASLARRFSEGECVWTLAELESDVYEAMRLAHSVRRGAYPRGCDTVKARLIDIVRREEHRPERIRIWELNQKASRSNAG